MEANNNNQNMNNNNAEQAGVARDPLINVRDRLFHTLFFRLSLAYARSCPRQLRRMLECFLLLKAIMCMLLLVYIHLVYTRQPVQCLEHVASSWPRDGVLRVEILKSPPDNYNVEQSYQKERKLALRHRELDHIGSLLFSTILTGDLGYAGNVEQQESGEQPKESLVEDIEDENMDDKIDEISDKLSDQIESLKELWKNEANIDNVSVSLDQMKDQLRQQQERFKEKDPDQKGMAGTQTIVDSRAQASKISVLVNMTDQGLEGAGSGKGEQQDQALGVGLKSDVSELEKLSKIVWPEDEYIVEYSLEIGFLRLSPATRQRLNIPVHIEVLDPTTNQCFGNPFSRFILENFLGYDDVLIDRKSVV